MEMMLPGALLQVLEAEEDVVLPETMIHQTLWWMATSTSIWTCWPRASRNSARRWRPKVSRAGSASTLSAVSSSR